MLEIDGIEYGAIVTALTRSFEVADGENAGRTLDGNMHRDLIGTYYNYSVTVMTDRMTQAKYNQLYEVISSPTESHDIVVAYGNETLTFKAYITQGTDDLLRQYSETNRYWGNLSFNFIAMKPQRRPI